MLSLAQWRVEGSKLIEYIMPHEAKKEKKYLVAIGTFRAGYGHMRACMSIRDALEALGILCQVIDLGNKRYPFATRKFIELQGGVLDFFYRFAPDLFMEICRENGEKGMRNFNRVLQLIDWGAFDKQLDPGVKLVIGSHMVIPDISKKCTIMPALDPYGPLYNPINPNTLIAVPNSETGVELQQLQPRDVAVIGPIVSRTVVEARQRFATRLQELEAGDGLVITITTGGSLSHGREIVGLTAAYIREMLYSEEAKRSIKKINVVIGDSDSYKKGGNMKLRLSKLLNRVYDEEIKSKINVIFDIDPFQLIRRADIAIGEADVIHAKTGELVYVVGGGKVFETFGKHPSLGIQEVRLRKYVEGLARENGLCALQQGEVLPIAEVRKVLQQYKSKNRILIKRMTAGLKVPVNGTDYFALLVKQQLEKLS
jgi:hypothetical protein